MFSAFCVLATVLDFFISVLGKTSIFLLPALLFFICYIFDALSDLFERQGLIAVSFLIDLPILVYGAAGQATAAVMIIDYVVIMAQAICGLLLLICFSIMKAKRRISVS